MSDPRDVLREIARREGWRLGLDRMGTTRRVNCGIPGVASAMSRDGLATREEAEIEAAGLVLEKLRRIQAAMNAYDAGT